MQSSSLARPSANFLPPPPHLLLPPSPRGLFQPSFPPFLPPPGISGPSFPPYFPPQQPRFRCGPASANFPGNPRFPPPPPPPGPRQWTPYQHKQRNKLPRKNRGYSSRESPHSGTNSGRPLFVCSPCHKEYKSQETYSIHLATHVKCSQCDFECSKGAMQDHQLIHYLPPELKFTSQEDIAKWRGERKKNFPTAENVQRKKQLEEKREKQGNVADTPFYRYVSHICGGDRGFSRRRGGRQGSHWVAGSKRKHPTRHADGGKEQEVEERQQWRGGRGGRGRGGGGKRGRYERKRPEGCGLKYVSAKKPTLLEKLLASEIRMEQNTLLQCIRYIVKNNFFRPDNDDDNDNTKSAENRNTSGDEPPRQETKDSVKEEEEVTEDPEMQRERRKGEGGGENPEIEKARDISSYKE